MGEVVISRDPPIMHRGLLSLLCLLTAAAASGQSLSGQSPGLSTTDADERGTEAAETAPRPLPFFYDLYTFRGDAGRSTVIAAFAVPVERLRAEDEEDGGVRYRFDVTLVLSDTTLHTVSRTDDSVFVSVPRRLDGEHLLHTHIEVDAPPSGSTVQRVIMTDATTPGIGQLYGSAFPIRDYSGADLMLSDIALGLPGAEAGWERGDATLALLPTSQFPRSSFDVYYEVYNLPSGHRYATEISVERTGGAEGEGGRAGRAVHTRFSGESDAGPDGTLAEMRRVQTSLARGRYRLTVTVTDRETGETTERSRFFQVRGWEQGVTMVPALPRTGMKARALEGATTEPP